MELFRVSVVFPVSFWYDNWIKQGALYYVEGESFQDEEIEVRNFIKNGKWDKQLLLSCLSEDIVDLNREIVKPVVEEHQNDRPWLIEIQVASLL